MKFVLETYVVIDGGVNVGRYLAKTNKTIIIEDFDTNSDFVVINGSIFKREDLTRVLRL